jgi:hypothetical protein
MGDEPAKIDDLQRQKLELEIRELRSWWLRPSAVAAISTIVLGILAFISAVWIGYFDKAKLDYERTKLAAEVEMARAEKGRVEARVAELQNEALRLQGSVRDVRADKVVSDSIAERRLSDAETELRTCLQGNQSLARANEEFRKANDTCLKHNQDWQEQSKKQQEELAGLRKTTAESKTAASGLRKQLSLYPPLVRESKLSYSTYDHEMSGEINGANFGAERGTVEIRPVKRVDAGRRSSPIAEPVVLTGDAVAKWSTSSIEYKLPLGPKNQLAQAVRGRFSGMKDYDWPDLLYSQEVDYEVRVVTSETARSEWTVMAKGTSWSTGPVRVGLDPDETDVK